MVKELPMSKDDFDKAVDIVNEVLKIIKSGFYPKKTKYLSRCIDCCYKNICV